MNGVKLVVALIVAISIATPAYAGACRYAKKAYRADDLETCQRYARKAYKRFDGGYGYRYSKKAYRSDDLETCQRYAKKAYRRVCR